MTNPISKLIQSRITGFTIASLGATWLTWNDLRPLLSRNATIMAMLVVFAFVTGMILAGRKFSNQVSESFVQSFIHSQEGRACIRSLAIAGLAALFVYTLGVWQLARGLGMLK